MSTNPDRGAKPERAVGTVTVHDGGYMLRYERRFDHSVDQVWAALTEPAELTRWLAEVEVDLADGGRIQLVWLNADDEGNTATATGQITRLDPPRLLEYDTDLHGLLRWELREAGEECALTFVNVTPAPDEYLTVVLAGWHFHLDALADALAGHAVDWPSWTPTTKARLAGAIVDGPSHALPPAGGVRGELITRPQRPLGRSTLRYSLCLARRLWQTALMPAPTPAVVVAVSRDDQHRFSKQPVDEITLLAGIGVDGDAHAGVTVQHRSRVAADPSQPNLRQVHLIHAELFDEVGARGFAVAPGQLGENITTRGVDLLSLPRGTVLRLGAIAPSWRSPACATRASRSTTSVPAC